MEQEFEPAKQDLLRASGEIGNSRSIQSPNVERFVSDIGGSNPLSKFVETGSLCPFYLTAELIRNTNHSRGSCELWEDVDPPTWRVIHPNPVDEPWRAPLPGRPNLKLTDSHIDLSRLVHLIDDSFDRKLDVRDYLKRVNDRIAGVIIAGEYEGAAILTWETPPGVVEDGSMESRSRMVPYLDKFAVLKKAQGSGGVADIVFTAMVEDDECGK
ncbi:putative Amino-acid acetyltransferase, mitochondrial [Glarea lozoyensis 74030]|uniref:Amino-acid acetyltransferase, mitochondrial n=1 Tax=Glarea lozoyensis (strain ATCC 74030 / MF5533) TaxID=1104152 RepID=H0EFF7_GLAL7|nr:putative Amino-acid acetyltransferase, mitochondrial [Glarea lozoyensis 74030]